MITINKNTTMGEIIEKVPEAASIIMKYFHGGCYACPSMKLETLEMAAQMHGLEVEEIIAEFQKLIGQKS